MGEPTQLVRPTEQWRQEFVSYCEEFKAANEPFVHDQLPEAIADFPALLRKWSDGEEGVNLPEGRVPWSVRWLVRGGRIIATARLRYRLNDDLTHEGGHIGYDVRPSERGKGYATSLLGVMLNEARAIGLRRVLLTCNKDNIASARTIQKNGGILENEVISRRTGKVVQRYWIDL